MKQYIYNPLDSGLAEWPSGTLRLEGIEITEDPKAADVFVVPGNLRIFEGVSGSGILDHAKLYQLPHLKGNEDKHVVFDVSDNFKQPINLPLIWLRCDVRDWMLKHDPNTVQIGWPVADLGDCVDVPAGGFKYDVSFHGWNSCLVRKVSAPSCKNNPKIAADVAIYPDFYGHIDKTPEGIRRRGEFLRSVRESRIMLCPESIPSVLPYRFFEAMSAGRYALLIGRGYVLPFPDLIPWDEFHSKLDIDQADEAGDAIAEIRSRHTDEVFIEKGKLARSYWEKYLNAADWPRIHAFAVQKHLAERAVIA